MRSKQAQIVDNFVQGLIGIKIDHLFGNITFDSSIKYFPMNARYFYTFVDLIPLLYKYTMHSDLQKDDSATKELGFEIPKLQTDLHHRVHICI